MTTVGGRLRLWWRKRKEYLSRPLAECPHCGHTWGLGSTHDKIACELGRLRREVEQLRAEHSGGDVRGGSDAGGVGVAGTAREHTT